MGDKVVSHGKETQASWSCWVSGWVGSLEANLIAAPLSATLGQRRSPTPAFSTPSKLFLSSLTCKSAANHLNQSACTPFSSFRQDLASISTTWSGETDPFLVLIQWLPSLYSEVLYNIKKRISNIQVGNQSLEFQLTQIYTVGWPPEAGHHWRGFFTLLWQFFFLSPCIYF